MFGSDNAAGVSREIMTAIVEADDDYAVAYGDDQWSRRLNAAYSEFFETETFVFPVATGTAANALALSAITPPYGEIFCYERSHIFTTECGAPEFYCGGARLVTDAGADGKLTTSGFKAYIDRHRTANRHHMIAAALSLTQATEFGTVYRPEEIQDFSAHAHAAGLKVHMDGARLANALVSLDVSPASMTWKVGVDILSLGTTKNGTMNAEAVIVFDGTLAKEIAVRQKRAGLLTSKMRFVSAQLLQILEDQLWKRNARQANESAAKLAAILQATSHAHLQYPVETNQIFVQLSDDALRAFDAAGICFRLWNLERSCFRLVTSFRTDEAELQKVRYICSSLMVL
jgi:threonine aldolase